MDPATGKKDAAEHHEVTGRAPATLNLSMSDLNRSITRLYS